MVAIALGTTNARAIKDVTKIKKIKVQWLLTSLQNNGWDIEATLADQCSDRTDNFSINKESYPILRLKGVFA